MISKQTQFILIAGAIFIGVWIMTSVFIIWLTREDDNTQTVTSSPADIQFAAPVMTEEADSYAIAIEPTVDRQTLQTELASVEGVSTIRIMEVSLFQDLWLVYLEIDVQAGYDTTTTADAIKAKVLPQTGENIQMVLILWDRVNRATNYTWDLPTQTWLTTMVMSNPE